jgi:thioredoxin reductase
MKNFKHYDVIIVGGSYAGLSAAMALGRSLRNVLIIDSGLPCNRQTPHSHNFLTQDGKAPKEISTLARAQVETYETVKFYEGIATAGTRTANGFEITTNADDTFTARKLIFATGIKDIMPDIDGFAECWGISIVHCPYCHGYEYRKQNTAIIGTGERAFHLASLVSNLTDSITMLSNGKADFTSEQRDNLKKHDIEVMETQISRFEYHEGQIQSIVFDDNTKMPFDVAYAAIPFLQHSDIPFSLGCERTEDGHIKVDTFQKTTVQGVFACGDNSSMMRSVAKAVYSGNLAGAAVNGELTNERF